MKCKKCGQEIKKLERKPKAIRAFFWVVFFQCLLCIPIVNIIICWAFYKQARNRPKGEFWEEMGLYDIYVKGKRI